MKSEKRKILVVCQHFWPESFRINDLCAGFVENNIEVDVLCGIPNYPQGFFYEGYSYFKNRKQKYNSINIQRVFEIPRKGNSNLMIFLNYLSFPFFSLFHIPRLLFKKYDKIFIYQLSPVLMAIAGILLGRIKNIETCMYVLDLWPENLFSVLDIQNKFLRKIAFSVSHWHYKNVDKLVVLSEGMKIKLLSVINNQKTKIIVIPQCCEKLYEENIIDNELVNRFSNTFNIVMAGNLSPAQSLHTVIELAVLLRDNNITNVKFIIVGDGMSRNEFEISLKKIILRKCLYLKVRSLSLTFQNTHMLQMYCLLPYLKLICWD